MKQFTKTTAALLVLSLVFLSAAAAFASGSGIFDALSQFEYADARLSVLDAVSESIPSSLTTESGITVELGQAIFEGNRVFVSYRIGANTDLIELHEGAPDKGIKWDDSMDNMIMGNNPANSQDVKKENDWLNGKGQRWLQAPYCGTTDGLELDDGTYLDIIGGYMKKQEDGSIIGWKECIIPDENLADTLTFRLGFYCATAIKFQDNSTYREKVNPGNTTYMSFTLNRNNTFRYLQGNSASGSYQADAEITMGKVDMTGKIRLVSPEQAASWNAWYDNGEGNGIDVIASWNLYQNGQLVSEDLYGNSEAAGTDEVIFEVMFPHLDDISGLTLVPVYSEGGERADEAIPLESTVR